MPIETTPTRQHSMTPLSAETQRLCLALYFQCFATSVPVIHVPTFNPDRRGSGLIRAMVSIGGFHSTDPEIRNTAKCIYTEEWSSMRQLFVTLKHNDPRSFDVITEVLLLSAFSFAQLDQHRSLDSRNLLMESLQFARQLGIGKALVATAPKPPETLHQRWLEWVKYETFKRLALLYMVVDGITSCVFCTPNLINFVEMRHNLPVDELIWHAETAEDWQNACLTTSANTESPVVDAIHQLLNSYRVPNNLNEVSSVLLSTCLLSNIRELSYWKALYIHHERAVQSDRQNPLTGPTYNQEISTRESQLRFAMNVMLDCARTQRLMTNSASSMWDITSTVQQLGYLRLYLPSVQTIQGIVSTDWTTIMHETVLAVVSEDLVSVDYRPITLLLNWFSELIMSQLHLQYQDLARSRGANFMATESSVGCACIVQVMVDIWRLLRFTTTYGVHISQSPEHSLARQGFLDTLKELGESVAVAGPAPSTARSIITEVDFALTLKQICLNMFQATRMGTFRVAADAFATLHGLVHAAATGQRYDLATPPPSEAWAMMTRCF